MRSKSIRLKPSKCNFKTILVLQKIRSILKENPSNIIFYEIPSSTNSLAGMKLDRDVIMNVADCIELYQGKKVTIKCKDRQFTFPKYLKFIEYTSMTDEIHEYALYAVTK
mgnify:CR=1 FL=1